jgi:chemotaxis family two-component system response regulator Rcp1
MNVETIQILLVEDSVADVRLTQEALRDARIANDLHVVGDGEEAMRFLRRADQYADVPRPDLVLLDLNLPRKDGREVLAEMKEEDDLRRIPVIVLTTSRAETDVMKAYDLHVNAYVPKPIDLQEFIGVVRGIEDFWLSIVKLPSA